MGRIVFLGHGGFDPTTGSDVAVVLVPPSTSLKFFSDAGQALTLPAKGGNSDYSQVVKVWDHFKEAEAPISEKGVTYNFRLSPEDSQEERDLALSLNWGAQVITLPEGSDKFYLCTGTAESCPTPKLNVAAARHDELVAKGDAAVKAFKEWLAGGAMGDVPTEIADFAPRLADVTVEHYEYVADGVPEGRWKHHCDGILDKHAGNELYWVACTSFVRATPGLAELPTLVTSDSSGPGAYNSAWEPDDDDNRDIREKNAKAVKDTAAGGSVAIVSGGKLVLIGRHADDPAEYVRRQSDIEEGILTVTKGGAFSKGGIEVTGIAAKQALVKSEIGGFSDKKVTFA
jgi:putative adhesin Stv-like protein